MIRAVIDTNILIRAAIRPQGTIGPIAHRLSQGRYLLIISEILFDELIEKLREPRIGRKYHLDEQAIQAFVEELAVSGELVAPTREIHACRDEDDNRVLEAAVTGGADFIVTADEDLLVLDPFEGIRIVRPHIFLAALD
ncbi:MAG: putative toxin-antitoxin system toxin component, PIN family [Anaerolineae bacterium]